MYLDIEKQLNKITDGLKQELLSAKAIDESGHAIDVKKFNEIIDKKIEQCNKILATTEKDGVTIDLYGANIAATRVDMLENMKGAGMIIPESDWVSGEESMLEEKTKNKPKKKEDSALTLLDNIFAEMNKSLKESKAIDKDGRATDIVKFHQIINKAIEQCNKAFDVTERDGYTFDRYGAQMLFKNIDLLKQMKAFDTINPEKYKADYIGKISKVEPSKEPMYKQLNQITSNLEDLLRKSKVINEQGNVIDIAKFHQIINDKIKQCYALLEFADQENPWSNAESDADEVRDAIDWLRKFKASEHVSFKSNNVTQSKTEKTNAFFAGISKILTKIQAKISPAKTSENNR